MKLFRKTHLYLKNKKIQSIQLVLQSTFGIYAKESGLFYDYQFKALTFFIKKKLKSYSKIFIRISMNRFVTKKPIGIRMGKGKGATDKKYLYINKGQLLYEFKFDLRKEENFETLVYLKKVLFSLNQKSSIFLKLVKL